MTTTLREILRQFTDNGDLDNEYVTLQEYEAIKVKAGNMSQDKEAEIINRDERIFELEKDIETMEIRYKVFASSIEDENEATKVILQQWAEASPGLVLLISAQLEPEQLKEFLGLIAATKTALGE